MNSTSQQQDWNSMVYDKLSIKMKAECERVRSGIPFIPRDGKYIDCMMPDGICWWTNGFWPGMLWQMYHATKDDIYKKAAEDVEERLDEAFVRFDRLHHDVGFMFLPSAIANYRITENEKSRVRGLHAANILAGRFNPTGNFIRAWDESIWAPDVSGWMIIDSLLNIPILYWATQETNDPRFADIANRHAHTALTALVREDGSCNHIASIDPNTGEFLGGIGGQGYGEGSSWSRGQAWSVYGFIVAYRHTKLPEYLAAAKNCAHYCIACLAQNDWIPLLDFRAPAEPVKYDSGAAAILSCAFLEIAEHVPEYEKALYKDAAQNTLVAIEKKFANWNPDEDGILGGGSTMYHDDRLSNASIIYGDYFLLEAILRLVGKDIFIW